MRTSRRLRRLAVLSVFLMTLGAMAAPAGASGDTRGEDPNWTKIRLISHSGIAGEEPAIHGSGNRILIAWTTGTHVYGRWSLDNGTTWGVRYLLGKGSAPAVAVNGTYGTVAWWRNGTVFGRHYDGSSWQAQQRLTPLGQACSYPSLYGTGNYTGLTFWRCKTPPEGPWLLTQRRSADSGATWGTYKTLQRQTDVTSYWLPFDAPATTSYGARVWTVAQTARSGGRAALYLHSSSDYGATWAKYVFHVTKRPLDTVRLAGYGPRAYVVFRIWKDGGYTSAHVYQRTCTAGGATCTAANRLTGGVAYWYPQFVAVYQGNVRTGFSRDGILMYRDSADYGATWADRYRLRGYSGYACHWRAWAAVDGTHTVFHHNGTSSWRTYYTRGTWPVPYLESAE